MRSIVDLVNLDPVDTVECCASYVDSHPPSFFSALFATVFAIRRRPAASHTRLLKGAEEGTDRGQALEQSD